MRLSFLLLGILFSLTSFVMSSHLEGLQIEVLNHVNGKRKTQRGDDIDVHYRGTLASNGKEFDASYKRGQPLSFTVGKGQVIKGWDEGLLDMHVGEKRKLTIAPQLAYGDQGVGGGLIPPKSTLSEE